MSGASADEPLRILFDAYWWRSGPPSGRNVVTSLVSSWHRLHPADRITLLGPRGDAADIRADLERRRVHADVRAASRFSRVHAMAARAAGRSDGRYDAIVTQNFATRSRSAISGVLVHDAMYVDHPEWFNLAERAYLALLRPSLRAADMIFTTSASETDRIARVWPETRARLHRVGLDVPVDVARVTPRRPDTVAEGERFILVVGRLNVRKNLARLISAFASETSLHAQHRLIVVGAPDGRTELLPPDAGRRIAFLDHVDDATLRWLYEHADLFVMPSLDEGFGLPLLEAKLVGTPAITSDLPVFREIGADGYFDPASVADIRRALRVAIEERLARRPGIETSWTDVVDRMRGGIVAQRERRRHHAVAA